jgi:Flp pilus assembly protein TadD
MAKHRRIHQPTVTLLDDALRARVRKLLRKGETRKAVVALREACLRDEGSASLWTIYGAVLVEAGRSDEARQAFRHAIWLRRSAGDAPRVRSTQSLLDRLDAPAAA